MRHLCRRTPTAQEKDFGDPVQSQTSSYSGPYTNEFFEELSAGSDRSARVVVPIICDLVHPSSVLDVGCGRGMWLQQFRRRGVERILGCDGSYITEEALLISGSEFIAVDLENPLPAMASFDLALCLEVVEHLSPAAGKRLVQTLTSLAPAILFSAAVPDQGGTNHVNEQWPEYWAREFAASHFVVVDILRPLLRDNRSVAIHYRQNLLLFCSETWKAEHPALESQVVSDYSLLSEWVHSYVHQNALRRRESGRHSAQSLAKAIARRLKLKFR